VTTVPPPRDQARVDDDEVSVRPAGRFRLYLGSAAGVGKTCAMLDEGWRRHQRGTDVVIGLVETHGRAHTAEYIRDLPIVPRRTITHRDAEFTEMDLAAVLERRPEVLLIDELAHTNVPGSGPHAKRWEDVLEILEAGIAVISTVNIQHVESLADAVERITGVPIRERVPDWVVRKADQLELIDSSADQLRRRMLHGNIYPAARVPAALGGFFRTENLVALRELALRFVADEADEELLRYLAGHHPDEVWETTERIMVAVADSPGMAAVVHRAARIASRVKGDLLAGHVATEEPESSERLAALRQLVDDVGGAWYEIAGDDAAKAIVGFAREHQITQIVFGARRLTRLAELRRGSAVRRLLREAADAGIDVHVIARRDEQPNG
jgi:two-component system, OmpR family, sensor histidine kinase KdpD